MFWSDTSLEDVYGEGKDGCPKIKGWIEGLTARGCGESWQGRARSVETMLLLWVDTPSAGGVVPPGHSTV